MVSLLCAGWASNSQSSCLSLLSAGIISVRHHTQWENFILGRWGQGKHVGRSDFKMRGKMSKMHTSELKQEISKQRGYHVMWDAPTSLKNWRCWSWGNGEKRGKCERYCWKNKQYEIWISVYGQWVDTDERFKKVIWPDLCFGGITLIIRWMIYLKRKGQRLK
jgi:hypothetical protein